MIVLPWPPKEASPNFSGHWSAKAKAKKKYRAACYQITKLSGLKAPEGKILVLVHFVPPDYRHRDDDNIEGAFKAGRDGMAEALGVDDSRFTVRRSIDPVSTKGGAVHVQIQPMGSDA